jgi:hypothetical protein
MTRYPHHFKIAFALAFSAGAWGIYWLPQRILVEGEDNFPRFVIIRFSSYE